MGNFVLCCDSTADLSKEHFERRDIHYVCFHFFLDGRNTLMIWASRFLLISFIRRWQTAQRHPPLR